jgi:uncharacterized protein YndB with AHSA1/START domain
MGIQTCPTTIIGASAERVWILLATPPELQRWTGARLRSGPAGLLAPGDRVILGTGIGGPMTVVFDVLEAEPPRRLTLSVSLPFGIVNHETIVITPGSVSECRVTFN